MKSAVERERKTRGESTKQQQRLPPNTHYRIAHNNMNTKDTEREAELDGASLLDGRGCYLLEVLHAPLLQELQNGTGLAAHTDVGHEGQVLHQTHSMTLEEEEKQEGGGGGGEARGRRRRRRRRREEEEEEEEEEEVEEEEEAAGGGKEELEVRRGSEHGAAHLPLVSPQGRSCPSECCGAGEAWPASHPVRWVS